MALTDLWQLMLVGYVFSYIGFSGSLLFYDSFMTDITTPDRMDKVSAWGYAMGYIGGSTIPFILSIALILFGEKIGIDGVWAVKLSCLLCVTWWALFSIPMLLNVRQVYSVDKPARDLIRRSLVNMVRTARDIVADKAILVFVLAYFFYIDGVNTVIHMATVYGSTLGLGTTGMILALLVTQIVAVPFSILFSSLAGRVGSIRMIRIAIVVYLVICATGFYMGYSLERVAPESPLYAAACSARPIFSGRWRPWSAPARGDPGLVRSFFGKLIPPKRSNEFLVFSTSSQVCRGHGSGHLCPDRQMDGTLLVWHSRPGDLFGCGLLTLYLGRRQLARAEAKGPKPPGRPYLTKSNDRKRGLHVNRHPPGRWSFPVRSSDTDAHSQLHLSALFTCMQEAAYLHLEQLDDLFGDFDELGLCWLLSRVSVRLDALPVWPETLVVETRHRGLRRLTFVRDFTFRSSDGRLLGQAVSEWLVADQMEHRPQRPDPAWLKTMPSEAENLPSCPRLPPQAGPFPDRCSSGGPVSAISTKTATSTNPLCRLGDRRGPGGAPGRLRRPAAPDRPGFRYPLPTRSLAGQRTGFLRVPRTWPAQILADRSAAHAGRTGCFPRRTAPRTAQF
jgi:UMF1 family MFS transporter